MQAQRSLSLSSFSRLIYVSAFVNTLNVQKAAKNIIKRVPQTHFMRRQIFTYTEAHTHTRAMHLPPPFVAVKNYFNTLWIKFSQSSCLMVSN